MAARKKIVPTVEVVESPSVVEEVELTLAHRKITSIIYKGIIKFTDGKALVSPEIAAELRVQRFVK